MKQQCRKGIDILDEIMSPGDQMNEGQMNEGQYKDLMEIFQHLFINS
jgi:hypothetical protein